MIHLWDTRTTDHIVELVGHTDNVKALAVSSDGSKMVSGSTDGTIKLWSISERRCVETFECHNDGNCVLLSACVANKYTNYHLI